MCVCVCLKKKTPVDGLFCSFFGLKIPNERHWLFSFSSQYEIKADHFLTLMGYIWSQTKIESYKNEKKKGRKSDDLLEEWSQQQQQQQHGRRHDDDEIFDFHHLNSSELLAKRIERLQDHDGDNRKHFTLFDGLSLVIGTLSRRTNFLFNIFVGKFHRKVYTKGILCCLRTSL